MKAKAYVAIVIIILLGLFAIARATVNVIQWQSDVISQEAERKAQCDYYKSAQDDAFFAAELAALNCFDE